MSLKIGQFWYHHSNFLPEQLEHHAEMVSEMKVFGISYEKLASGIDFVDFCEDVIFFHRMFSAEMILYGEKS